MYQPVVVGVVVVIVTTSNHSSHPNGHPALLDSVRTGCFPVETYKPHDINQLNMGLGCDGVICARHGVYIRFRLFTSYIGMFMGLRGY